MRNPSVEIEGRIEESLSILPENILNNIGRRKPINTEQVALTPISAENTSMEIPIKKEEISTNHLGVLYGSIIMNQI